ncbi:hypothetical protein C0991_007120 [Blastosporella zonata]|nr:hypothetical protein C0991_007120 [Blastosporella zonata]
MPLPESTISLGPPTNPGEMGPAKPKVAMLVRLSSATIDALTSLGEKKELDFEFGNAPGIHIDGTFYPMRMQKEETPHEIYLHTSTKAGTGTGTLKLYANVTQKLFIEHHEIGDDLKDKIRERTLEAVKQRDDRKTKFIDAPPALPAKTATKKKTTMFRNNIRPSDQAKLNASTSTTRVPSPAPPPPKKKRADPALRNRLIHCMAVQERTRDAIIKLVSGGDASIRRDIVDLLEEVGEPTSALKKGEDLGSKTWVLKNEAWLEVHPMEWPNLSEAARIQLQRTGRLKLKSMGFKDTDPQWAPFAFRATDSGSAASSAGPSRLSTNETQQRGKSDGPSKTGLMSKDVKKLPKPPSDPNAEVRMKDESAKTAPRASGKMKEAAASNAPATAGTRKLPGSGFKSGKLAIHDLDDTHDSTPRGKVAEKDARPHRPAVPPKAISSALPKERPSGSVAATQRVKKVREYDAGHGSESEREKVARPKPTVKQEGTSERRDSDMHTLKRRPRDDYDSDASTSLAAPQKKKKTENGTAVVTISSKDARPRDLSLPKKPDVPQPPPRQKIRQEPSPLPPLPPPLPKINKKANTSSRPSTTLNESKMSPPESTSSTQSPHDSRGRGEFKVSAKRRRGSPIYTSSSDEADTRNVKARHDPPKVPSPAPPPVPTTGRSAAQSRPRVREPEPEPLPTDHAALRVRYTATYGKCIAKLGILMAQKSIIDARLLDAESGSVTDSDGEGELLEIEELQRLSREYARMHEELETIRKRFTEPVQ